MRTKTGRKAAAAIAAVLLISIISSPAVVRADDDVEAVTFLDENPAGGAINENKGTIGVNRGTVSVNTGETVNNFADINTNNGTVDYNYGSVNTNGAGGRVEYSLGSVDDNQGTVVINDGGDVGGMGGTVIINVNGTVGDETVAYNLGDNAQVSNEDTNVINRMWEIVPMSADDWSDIEVSGDGMVSFDDATTENAAIAQSLKWIDLDGSVISVWVSGSNNGVIYLSKSASGRDITSLSAADGYSDMVVITRMDDGSWRLSDVTGDVRLSYVLAGESSGAQEAGGEGEHIPVAAIVKKAVEWTFSDDNAVTSAVTGSSATTVAADTTAYTMTRLSDPAVRADLLDFLLKNLGKSVDASKAKVLNSLTVSMKEPGTVTVSEGISGLDASAKVYVSCMDPDTGEKRYVKATVEAANRISFYCPFARCSFLVVSFD